MVDRPSIIGSIPRIRGDVSFTYQSKGLSILHLFYISEDIPYPGFSGSGVIGWAWVNYFLQQGHQVTLFVDPPRVNLSDEDRNRQLEKLAGLDCRIVSINDVEPDDVQNRSLFSRFFDPEIENLYLSTRQ